MNKQRTITATFWIATAYDGILGIVFLLAAPSLFEWASVTPPNHWGYVQFPAALLIIFALMFAAIARDPLANRQLIPYGFLLKIAYCGVVFTYWFSQGLPDLWKPWAIADAIFAASFFWAYRTLASRPAPAERQKVTV